MRAWRVAVAVGPGGNALPCGVDTRHVAAAEQRVGATSAGAARRCSRGPSRVARARLPSLSRRHCTCRSTSGCHVHSARSSRPTWATAAQQHPTQGRHCPSASTPAAVPRTVWSTACPHAGGTCGPTATVVVGACCSCTCPSTVLRHARRVMGRLRPPHSARPAATPCIDGCAATTATYVHGC